MALCNRLKSISLLIFFVTTGAFAQERYWRDLYERGGMQYPTGVTNIFQAGGIDLNNIQELVVLSFDPNVGDTVLTIHPRIAYIHERYPHLKIRFISPTSSILQESTWLRRETIDLTPLMSGEADSEVALTQILDKSLLPHLGPEKALFWDPNSIDAVMSESRVRAYAKRRNGKKVDVPLTDITEKMVGQVQAYLGEAKTRAVGMRGVANLFVVNQKNQIPGAGSSDAMFVSKVIEFHSESNRASPLFVQDYLALPKSNYVYTEAKSKLLLDPAYATPNLTELYVDPKNFSRIVDSQRATFYIPDKEYVFLNFNTRGAHKISKVSDGYTRRVEEFFGAIDGLGNNPNIFLTEPEGQFGPEISAKVRGLINAYPGRVKILSQNTRGDWPALIKGASFVLTEDSGFAHVANALLPPEKVIIFSSAGGDGNGLWTKPGQPMHRWKDAFKASLSLMAKSCYVKAAKALLAN